MRKETVSGRQAICIICLFILGSTIVMGGSSESKQDAWISMLLASLFFTPAALVYGRIIRLFPETDLFDIMVNLFGKFAGNILILLMVWYSVHLCALVLRNFSEFIQVVSLPETPALAIMTAIILITVYMVKSGIETMGKWAIVALPIIVSVIFLTIILSLRQMDFTNLLPVMEQSIGKTADNSFLLFSFPFAETVLFICIADSFKKKDNPYKLYYSALLVGTVILLFVIIRNITLLGPAMLKAKYFPSYVAVRLIDVGHFLSRIEGSIAMNFILAGTMKISICLLAASKGTAKLFGIQNYRQIVLPVGLLVLALCAILYKNIMEMFGFLPIYKYYAIPFQILIPLVVWVTAEIKTRRQNAKIQKEAAF